MGTCGDPNCGDFSVMTIRVCAQRLADVCFLVRGCGAAIATCSMATELVKSRTLKEADQLTDEDVVQALGGLPEVKLHCSILAATALHRAIEHHYRRCQVSTNEGEGHN